MAKKDRFPDAYSGGFPPNEESEGSGGSGRDHMETSGYENSSGPREKWIKLSSALHDGFGVPIQSVPISTLPSSEKQKWLLQLRSELDLLRTFKKKVDTNRDRTHATMSSSSNIITSNKPQGNQPTSRKASDPQPRINPGIKRLQSVTERSSPETFTLLLRKQCENLLKKLMGHQHGWVFNKPVDVVALKIPDYFNVIKKPMDLGTIKEKLASSKYSSPFQFAADVRLTFSNAMTYNPPGNDVHIMADILSKFFELRWKPIEKKLPVNSSQQQQQASVHEVIDLVKPMPPSKKRKVTSTQQNQLPDAVKLVMTNDEKLNLSRELEAHLGDLPDNIIDFLRKHGSNGGEGGEDEIEIDIDALNDDALFELRKMLDDHVQTKQNHAKAEPCVIELLNESGLSNSTMQLYKGNDVADEDLDAGGNEPPVSSYPVVELNNETSKHNNNQTTIGTSSGSNSSSASENEVKDVKACSSFSGPKDMNAVGTDLDHKMEKNHSAENRSDAEEKPNSIESDSQKDDGDSAPNERQVSPDKLYRAALLKNRFADTIFKAREKTLNQDEKADPEKLKREKEQLENQKRKEKARLQAEAKAAEEARKRVEAEAAAEAKRKRDLEREAARQALLKIEKTVEIDEASRFLKDLEMLRAADTEPGLSLLEDEIAPEQEHESLDNNNNNNNGGLGGFNFGGSNALEQLGLYMKRDDDDDDDGDNEEEEVETQVDPGTFLGDVEEGEIN